MTDPMDPTPLYIQVADLIAARIEAGELRPRDPIPSELSIQQAYGVARGTARRAVETLRDRGLVVTIPQRGTYVVERPTP
ncbi:GntR family transcriptional regulator [Dactylosporangium sp. CA-152071]|uniref:GntR family transcriptional regulator n=1 Tax=Dactylosporangium sp. CA-152071 TaxID=3239933 RepID=UPI003D93A20C